MKKQLVPFLFVALCSLFCGILFSYIFSNRKEVVVIPAPDNGKKKIDSIYNEQVKKHEQDSATKATLSKQLDSVKKVAAEKDVALTKERKKVLQLAEEVKYARLVFDTSSYYKYCDELSAEVKILDNAIENYKEQIDSLLGRNYALTNVLNTNATEWRKTSQVLQQQAGRQAAVIDSLNTVLILKTNKAKKRYTLGVGGFGGLHNKGVGGGVGIVVCRRLFSF